MTTLIRGTNSYFMGAQAFLLDESTERETASEWATKHVKTNPAIKWILGRYVEADNPNNNRQAWALEDLRLAQPTVDHAPMNMIHQAHNIVGAYVATEMIYPTESADDGGIQNPYVEALAAFWKYYFPEELAVVQKAHDEGQLYFSMECVAKSLKFEDPTSGDTQEFAYKGPFHDSYGTWNERADAIRWLNEPHFLGGALIVPPVKPGWSKADIKSLASYVQEHQEIAEAVYASVEQQSPHLSPKEIEGITLGLIQGQIDEEWSSLVENSNSADHLSNNNTYENSDGTASEVSHPQGGDMSTYTEDELKAAVAEAVKPLVAEVEALKAQADADAVETRIAEMTAKFETDLAEVQAALDAATIEAQVAKAEREDVIAYLAAEVQAAEEATARAEREGARLAAVKEAANFPDEFVAAHTERWVAMSDEDFDATIEGYKVAAESAKAVKEEAPAAPTAAASTAMNAERETAGAGNSDLGDVMRLRFKGIDPRTV